MQVLMVGLGRMGANLARRLMRDGHQVVGYDVSADAVAALTSDGGRGTTNLGEAVAMLDAPRTVWVMVPASLTGATVDAIADLLEPGDTIIDGGNSYYRDDLERAAQLTPRGLHYVDIGTSGGVWGLDRGYCLMVGGEPAVVAALTPILDTLAPGVDAAPRTPGRSGDPQPAERGWLHCGPSGAGHFVKMVHNGIEYGLMAAYAEGFAILRAANAGAVDRAADAETAPLAHPEHYRYDIDTTAVAELWRRGSVVGSWLLDLTASALAKDPDLDGFGGRVSDSGEGRWTALAAVETGVPAHVLTASLYERFSSRGESLFADKLLSALRKEFGGHHEGTAP